MKLLQSKYVFYCLIYILISSTAGYSQVYGDGSDGVFSGGTLDRSRVYQFSEINMLSGSEMNFSGEGSELILVAGNMFVAQGAIINLRKVAEVNGRLISIHGIERNTIPPEVQNGAPGVGAEGHATYGIFQHGRGGKGGEAGQNGELSTGITSGVPGGIAPGGAGGNGTSIYYGVLNGNSIYEYQGGGGGAGGGVGESCEQIAFVVEGSINMSGIVNGQGADGGVGGKGGNGFQGLGGAGGGGAGGGGGHGGIIYFYSYSGIHTISGLTLNLSGGHGAAGGNIGAGWNSSDCCSWHWSGYCEWYYTPAENGTAGMDGIEGYIEFIDLPHPTIHVEPIENLGILSPNSIGSGFFVVENTGGYVLNVSSIVGKDESIRFQSDPSKEFVDDLPSFVVEANSEQKVFFEYKPPESGENRQEIKIISDDLLNKELTLEVFTSVKNPIFQIMDPSHFGDVSLGDSRVEKLSFSNIGNASLLIYSIRSSNQEFLLSIKPQGPYRLVIPSLVLDPDEVKDLYVKYSPEKAGESESILSIETNSIGQSYNVKTLLGKAISPLLSIDQFEHYLNGQENLIKIGISNSGIGELKWVASSTESWLSIVSNASGTNTGQLNVNAAQNEGNQRLGYVIIDAPGQIENPDTVFIHQSEVQCLPNWKTIEGTNSTVAYGIVDVEGQNASEGDLVGCFVNDTCRGYSEVVVSEGVSYVTLNIQGSNKEDLYFKLWDVNECQLKNVNLIIQSNPGGTLGYPPDFLLLRAGEVSDIKPLTEGWNWFSMNVEGSGMSVGAVLNNLPIQANDYIKNQTISSTYYDGFGWFGEMDNLDVRETYKIKLGQAGTLRYDGYPVDPSQTVVPVSTGWNWIGYLGMGPLPVAEALASLVPADGDYIKNQTVSATFYDGLGWFGGLTNMEPLDGFMLKSGHPGEIIYPAGAPLVKSDSLNAKYEMQEVNHPVFKAVNSLFQASAFEYSGQVNAAVYLEGQNVGKDGDLLLTMSEDRILGVSHGLVFPLTGETIYGHMSYSNSKGGRDLEFYHYDDSEDQWYGFEETLSFTADMIEANAWKPFRLEKAKKIDNPLTSSLRVSESLSIYPNPVSISTTLSFTIATKKEVSFEIFDGMGRVVERIDLGTQPAGKNHMIWNAREFKQGIYFIRMVGSENRVRMVITR